MSSYENRRAREWRARSALPCRPTTVQVGGRRDHFLLLRGEGTVPRLQLQHHIAEVPGRGQGVEHAREVDSAPADDPADIAGDGIPEMDDGDPLSKQIPCAGDG